MSFKKLQKKPLTYLLLIILPLFIVLLTSCSAHTQGAASFKKAVTLLTSNLSHPWTPPQCNGLTCNIVSTIRPADPPPSTVAMLGIELATSLRPATLQELINRQADDIRKKMPLEDYKSHDGHKSKQGVASWVESFEGRDIGYIKYFIQKDDVKVMTRHGITIDNKGRVFFVHAMSLDEKHRAQVLADQKKVLQRIAHLNAMMKK